MNFGYQKCGKLIAEGVNLLYISTFSGVHIKYWVRSLHADGQTEDAVSIIIAVTC